MENEEPVFSSLKTISSFDNGEDSTVALNLDNAELERFNPTSLFVESVIEQLCRLLEKDPRNGKKLYLSLCEKLHQVGLLDATYQRGEFEFMRSYYRNAFYQLITVAKSMSIDKALISPDVNDSLKISSAGEVQGSRYRNEFEELEYLAKGGFGNVFKARHKLDGEIYAIKKIIFRYNKSLNHFLQYIKEVKMLAKLNHPNIVFYKAAWLEPIVKKTKHLRAIQMSEEINDKEESDGVVFESSEKVCGTLDEVEKGAVVYSSSTTTSSSSSRSGCIDKYKRIECAEVVSLPDSATLYIQMQLCHQTLREWLDVRNSNTNSQVNIEIAMDIYSKMLKGVEYIHSQGIVHHDIKPSNVFVSEDLQHVQVGDFGLACNLLNHQGLSPSILTHQSGPLGTKLYAAPEQLKGTCDPKNDVYSLGIVLFELVQIFHTAMERSKEIGQLKSGHIPTNGLTSYPLVGQILRDSLNSRFQNRPSSGELLILLEESQNLSTQKVLAQQKETIHRLHRELATLHRESSIKDEEIATLQRESSIKDEKIATLHRESSIKDEEIATLRQQLQKLQP